MEESHEVILKKLSTLWQEESGVEKVQNHLICNVFPASSDPFYCCLCCMSSGKKQPNLSKITVPKHGSDVVIQAFGKWFLSLDQTKRNTLFHGSIKDRITEALENDNFRTMTYLISSLKLQSFFPLKSCLIPLALQLDTIYVKMFVFGEENSRLQQEFVSELDSLLALSEDELKKFSKKDCGFNQIGKAQLAKLVSKYRMLYSVPMCHTPNLSKLEEAKKSHSASSKIATHRPIKKETAAEKRRAEEDEQYKKIMVEAAADQEGHVEHLWQLLINCSLDSKVRRPKKEKQTIFSLMQMYIFEKVENPFETGLILIDLAIDRERYELILVIVECLKAHTSDKRFLKGILNDAIESYIISGKYSHAAFLISQLNIQSNYSILHVLVPCFLQKESRAILAYLSGQSEIRNQLLDYLEKLAQMDNEERVTFLTETFGSIPMVDYGSVDQKLLNESLSILGYHLTVGAVKPVVSAKKQPQSSSSGKFVSKYRQSSSVPKSEVANLVKLETTPNPNAPSAEVTRTYIKWLSELDMLVIANTPAKAKHPKVSSFIETNIVGKVENPFETGLILAELAIQRKTYDVATHIMDDLRIRQKSHVKLLGKEEFLKRFITDSVQERALTLLLNGRLTGMQIILGSKIVSGLLLKEILPIQIASKNYCNAAFLVYYCGNEKDFNIEDVLVPCLLQKKLMAVGLYLNVKHEIRQELIDYVNKLASMPHQERVTFLTNKFGSIPAVDFDSFDDNLLQGLSKRLHIKFKSKPNRVVIDGVAKPVIPKEPKKMKKARRAKGKEWKNSPNVQLEIQSTSSHVVMSSTEVQTEFFNHDLEQKLFDMIAFDPNLLNLVNGQMHDCMEKILILTLSPEAIEHFQIYDTNTAFANREDSQNIATQSAKRPHLKLKNKLFENKVVFEVLMERNEGLVNELLTFNKC